MCIVPLILQMKKIKLRWVSGAPTSAPTLDLFPSKTLTSGRKPGQVFLRLVALFIDRMLVTQVCSA